MIQLDLSPEESAILVAVLESYLSDLRMEIANTDRMEFRDSLKERKAVILKAVAALESSSGTARPRK